MSAPVKGTKPYLIVCQHGDHYHVSADTLEDAQKEARSCFMECDCQPVIYERVPRAPVPDSVANEYEGVQSDVERIARQLHAQHQDEPVWDKLHSNRQDDYCLSASRVLALPAVAAAFEAQAKLEAAETVCPVCSGSGNRPWDFYDSVPKAVPRVQCRRCDGHGTISRAVEVREAE